MSSNRKEYKKKSRKVLKKHYLVLVIICLASSLVATSFDSSLGFVKYQKAYNKEHILQYQKKAKSKIESYKEKEDGTEILGHKEGVLAGVVNGLSSQSYSIKIIQGVNKIFSSTTFTIKFLIIVSTVIVFIFKFFVTNGITVIQARLFLEGRKYEKLPPTRITHIFKIKRWFKSCLTIFIQEIYLFLWFFTIIGGFIKMFSYALVPYIVAENPDIKPNDAINLSRKLMHGHKFELFCIQLSFILWEVLAFFTLNITKIMYSAPYKAATICEFYVKIRKDAKKKNIIPNIELLDDKYLYEKATEQELKKSYNDILKKLEEIEITLEKPTTLKEKIFDIFGIASSNIDKETKYEKSQFKIVETKKLKDELKGKSYPTRLFKIQPNKEKEKKENLNYMRRYPLSSLLLIFFSCSFIGWLWEVSFHLISDGKFINRGIQYGPWLPIYGTGAIIILTTLNKFRKKPIYSFVTAIIVCGIVEYSTSYFLEVMHNGTKWWDYSGYFLNLNGRICAEGLIVFGIGGLAIVYFVAPFLDNQFRKLDKKLLYKICIILTTLFLVDLVYSSIKPNIGKGITYYSTNTIIRNDYWF